MRKSFVFALVLTALAQLSACSSLRLPGVYRLVIQQGNIVTQDMVDQLEPGMTKRQVNFVLGTPLIRDTFNSDRWDYVYTLRDANGEVSQKQMTVYFENDKLTHFNGDYRPTPAGGDETQTRVSSRGSSEDISSPTRVD